MRSEGLNGKTMWIYSEPVEYMDGYEEKEEEIKAFLIEKSLEW